MVPELILCACANVVSDSISGGGSGEVAHSTPTDQKPSIAPIFVHSSAEFWRPKEKPAVGKGGLLNKRHMEGRGTIAR